MLTFVDGTLTIQPRPAPPPPTPTIPGITTPGTPGLPPVAQPGPSQAVLADSQDGECGFNRYGTLVCIRGF
jgi:hypothetical protein